jgi:hypothetical protein
MIFITSSRNSNQIQKKLMLNANRLHRSYSSKLTKRNHTKFHSLMRSRLPTAAILKIHSLRFSLK